MFHNSEMQRRWAIAFLAPHLQKLSGNEKILDIGCGDGKITADVSRFVKEGEVLGIDPSLAMIEWGKKQFSSQEYPNLKFQLGGFLSPSLGSSFDLIYSTAALQHCTDQLSAFKNLASLLKPEGKLLVMIPAFNNAYLKKAIINVEKDSRWSPYFKDHKPRKFFSIEEAKKYILTTGFTPIRIENIETIDPFVDRQELLSFFMGTFPALVPKECALDFYNEWIDEYFRLLPEAFHDGIIEARFGRIEIEAIKL
ncbi:class I SAM-dependent methyltransferase [Criblamydia sequanensis]|uniref:Methyltransferase n=1 Tax=Candidatus Criblamydia sequanensis CRIB-18 TaxID=1437425 RepID=A0A090D096_9BACT|nr:class I SAM-dependent methyltransferase [Criblamydia sequanensis]CDR34927.1 Methyltransferase [Criblamydia sequanensis CRIB-18]